MRWLISTYLLLALAGCAPKGESSTGAGESPDAAAKAEFAAAEEATAWMIDTKHTLAGLDPSDGHGLMSKLLELGVAEMKVAEVVPDSGDPSYKSAHRLLIKLPRNEKERNEVQRFVSEFAGSSLFAGTDFLTIEFPIKR